MAHEETLTEADRHRIEAAVAAAESRTSAEIVCVLARSSGDGTQQAPLVWGAALALAAPWPLMAFTQLSAERIFLAQLGVFVLASLLLSLPGVRSLLTPQAAARARADRAAREQFHLCGLTRTRKRTGVLIYVSMQEHYARIIADEGIAAHVAAPDWRRAVDLLTSHIRQGDAASGFVAAIEHCAPLLAAHFPPRPGDDDELPNRVRLT